MQIITNMNHIYYEFMKFGNNNSLLHHTDITDMYKLAIFL